MDNVQPGMPYGARLNDWLAKPRLKNAALAGRSNSRTWSVVSMRGVWSGTRRAAGSEPGQPLADLTKLLRGPTSATTSDSPAAIWR